MSDPPLVPANLVRPYTLTAGRTDTTVNLPMEAPVQVLDSSAVRRWPPDDIRGKIVALCGRTPTVPSVAEISALLDVPLGVARVLVGDLVSSGYLRVQTTLTDRSSQDERRELIGRTIRGLRAL